ncbi:hypothetical protein M595_5920 [Lyngbya aestuarii BL J]|uniref:Uncharacterized protein n=1 Tax=Lyngbya aestuarii BL J TaxID=1348334 RepID=U7QAR9_9CYAN|nr:hypothetical protein M595_5920 [Lyngbya aestuarii BL J]
MKLIAHRNENGFKAENESVDLITNCNQDQLRFNGSVLPELF